MTEEGIPYAIIGGLAVQFWGQPRFTADVDLTILVPPGSEMEAAGRILQRFPGRRADAKEFSRQSRVLLLEVPDLCPADISYGLPGFEEGVVARSVWMDLGDGRRVRVCSAEDLIIQKALAGRGRDLEDLRGIIQRQRERLDTRLIRRWLHEFSTILETHEPLLRYEATWEKYGRP